MKNLFKFLSIIVISQYAHAQDRVITTGVPFLLIAADARSAGMADMGVATSADAYSQQYNPSKYAFSKQKQGFSMSYTPYLTSIANDISLGQLTYFNRFNDRMAFSGSLRYFGFGDIELRKELRRVANEVMLESGIDFLTWPDYFVDEKGNLKFDIMEPKQSVHIRPKYYMKENKKQFNLFNF